MTLEQLPRRSQRILALVILIGLLGLTYLVFVMPLVIMAQGYDEEIDRLDHHLASFRQVIAEGETAKQRLRQVSLAEKRNGYYLESDRPALAAAELQRRLKQIVEKHGGSIISSQVLGEREGEELHRVMLRVNMRMGLPAFERILYALETQPPVLLLDNITIVARPTGSTAKWKGSSEQQELDASIDVMGYRNVGSNNET